MTEKGLKVQEQESKRVLGYMQLMNSWLLVIKCMQIWELAKTRYNREQRIHIQYTYVYRIFSICEIQL